MRTTTLAVVVVCLCTLSVAQKTSYPRPRIVASNAETVNSPTGMIPLTTIVTPDTSGLFRLTAYMVETVASPACDPSGNCGTLNMAVYWTDGGGQQSDFAIDAYY